MIKQYSLTLLQKAINQALMLDESIALKLRPLDDKRLKLIIRPLQVHFFIHFVDGELHLLAESQLPADTTIESSPLGFIRLSLLPSSKLRSLFNDGIRIEGDLELGQTVKKIFDTMDIDWEGHIARFTGDVIAHQMGSVVRQGLNFQRDLRSSLRRNVSEYLQEELRLFPGQEELNDFFNEVDNLHLEVERLECHIKDLCS
jgi:ubiquinone biosynthesis protein UbiJ